MGCDVECSLSSSSQNLLVPRSEGMRELTPMAQLHQLLLKRVILVCATCCILIIMSFFDRCWLIYLFTSCIHRYSVKKAATGLPKRKAKATKENSDSEEEWNLETSDDDSSAEDEDYMSESLSDSDSEDGDIKNTTKRLQKGRNEVTHKRKKLCASSSTSASQASTSSMDRPPRPSSLSTSSSQASAYSQYSAHSQNISSVSASLSPSSFFASSTPTAQSTPNGSMHHLPPPHITPSPRQGGAGAGRESGEVAASSRVPATTPTPVVVNRIPLPEGVTGLGSHDHNAWTWLKPATRKDKEGRKTDHPDYNPRTIYIPAAVIKEQTPAMKQWFEIKQDYFDTVLFFKVCNCNTTFAKR